VANIYTTDMAGTDVVAEPDAPAPPADAVAALSFEMAVGDDGVSCVGGAHCSVLLNMNSQRTLQVIYTLDGVPAASKVIYFEITEDPLGLGGLTALSTYTDEEGVGSVEVQSLKSAQGELVVKATILDESVAPLYFDVVVTAKHQVPLTISTAYTGSQALSSWQTRLYAQGDDGAPGCDEPMLLYDASIVATIQGPPKLLTQTAKFLELPGLVEGAEQRYTVLAYSEDEQGTLLAWGCDHTMATVSSTTSTTLEVALIDRPPTFAGTYNVTTLLDLSSGVPEPYKSGVDTVLGLFQSPAGQLLSLVCDIAQPGGNLESLCGLIYEDPANPDLDTVTATGAVLVDLINAVIDDLSAQSTWGVALAVGKDVAEMFTGLQLHGTLTFLSEPGADATWTASETAEDWMGLTLKWGLNANCDPETDPDCGEKNLFLTAIQPEAVSGSFEASLDALGSLTIMEHTLNLYYGQLLDGVLQKLLLPFLAGDGSDGEPAITSYQDLMGMLVGGGKACLSPANPTTCCQDLLAAIETQTSLPGASTATLIEGACEDLLVKGSHWLSSSLTELDSDQGLLIATSSPCPSYDVDGDLIIDAFGSKDPAGECAWSLKVGGEDPVTFEATFTAVRAD
jgi:hypothetical protein